MSRLGRFSTGLMFGAMAMLYLLCLPCSFAEEGDIAMCLPREETPVALRPTAAAVGVVALGDRELTDATRTAISSYLRNYCRKYNRGKAQCLGHSEGFGFALLESSGVQPSPEMLRKHNPTRLKSEALPLASRSLEGAPINRLDEPSFWSKLRPGMLIHTRCNCSPGGGHCYPNRHGLPAEQKPAPAHDRTADAHHWVVFAGTRMINGAQVPMVFDNNSMLKGCAKLPVSFISTKNQRRVLHDPFDCGANVYSGQCRVDDRVYDDPTGECIEGGARVMRERNCAERRRCLDQCHRFYRDNGAPNGTFCDPANPEACLYSMATLDKFAGSGWDSASLYCPTGRVPCVHCVRSIFPQ